MVRGIIHVTECGSRMCKGVWRCEKCEVMRHLCCFSVGVCSVGLRVRIKCRRCEGESSALVGCMVEV